MGSAKVIDEMFSCAVDAPRQNNLEKVNIIDRVYVRRQISSLSSTFALVRTEAASQLVIPSNPAEQILIW
jgi:hypothetical protein